MLARRQHNHITNVNIQENVNATKDCPEAATGDNYVGDDSFTQAIDDLTMNDNGTVYDKFTRRSSTLVPGGVIVSFQAILWVKGPVFSLR